MSAAAAPVWEFSDEAEIAGGEQSQPSSRLELVEDWDATEKQGSRERSGLEEDSGATGFVYDGALAGRALRAGLSRRSACARPLPMEDVTLFVKRIDNSGVRRSANPVERRAFWKMIGGGLAGLLLLVLCFGPRAWLRHSGYRQAELVEQRQELTEIQHHLLVRHAQLSDLRRVGRLAAAQGLAEPPPERYTWQDRTISAEPSDAALVQDLGAIGP